MDGLFIYGKKLSHDGQKLKVVQRAPLSPTFQWQVSTADCQAGFKTIPLATVCGTKQWHPMNRCHLSLFSFAIFLLQAVEDTENFERLKMEIVWRNVQVKKTHVGSWPPHGNKWQEGQLYQASLINSKQYSLHK